MSAIEIRINKEKTFRASAIAVLLVYYFPFSCIIPLAAIIFLFFRISRFPICGAFAAVILGLALNLSVAAAAAGASTGLNPESIDSFQMELIDDSSRSASGGVVFKGRLCSVSGRKGETCSASGVVLLINRGDCVPVYKGETIIVAATLESFSDSREFDYIAFSRRNPEVREVASGLFLLRKDALMMIDSGGSELQPAVFSLFKALFIGNSDLLKPELKDRFRESGVPHLLALSGFHVAILVLILSGAASAVAGKRVASLAVLPLLYCYLLLAGGSPSLLRAVLMFSLSSVFRFRGRDISFMTIILGTALIQLIIAPVQGWSLSFQLSYLALGGIVLLGNRVRFCLDPFLPAFLAMPISASIGAHIATAPVLIIQFGELYPVGLVASLIVTPLVVLFMWISLGAFAISMAGLQGFLFKALSFSASLVLNFIEESVSFFSSAPSLIFSGLSTMAIYLSITSIVVVWLYRNVWRVYGRGKGSRFKLRFTRGD